MKDNTCSDDDDDDEYYPKDYDESDEDKKVNEDENFMNDYYRDMDDNDE